MSACAHPSAGRCTADMRAQPAALPATPAGRRSDALDPHVWPRSAHARTDGVLHLGGRLGARAGRASTAPRLYVLDEADFRGRCRGLRATLRRRRRATTPARRSSAARSPAGSPRRACASTSAPAASCRRAGGRVPARADRAARQQQVASPSCSRARRRRGRAGRRRLVRRDRPAGSRWPRGRRRRPAAGADPGHRRRRGAHPRVHRHRARGPEVRLLARQRRRADRGGRASIREPAPRARRAALAHRLADLRHLRLRGRRAPGGRAAGRDPRRGDRRGARRARPRRRLRHRLHRPRTTRRRRRDLAEPAARRSSTRECAALGLPVPRLSVEPGRAIVGPAMVTLYEVGTVKGRSAAGPIRDATSASTAG